MLVNVNNDGVFSCHRLRGGLPLLQIGTHTPFVGRMVFVDIDNFLGKKTDIASVLGWQAAAAGQRSKDASGDGLEGQMGGGAGKGRGVAVLTWDVEVLVEFCELSAGVSTQYALVYIRVTHSRWVM